MKSNVLKLNEKALEELEYTEKPWNNSSDISMVGKEKLDALKKEIREIKELIENREKLSQEVFKEAERVKMQINNFLAEIRTITPVDAQDTRERIALKHKEVELAELQIKEKTSSWQDIAKLKEELREKEKELSEKESRIKMLDRILEEN
ncbi:MAG: hypothetical protein ACP5OG_02915 [Candidatus Nanoarchaeia archaeon]